MLGVLMAAAMAAAVPAAAVPAGPTPVAVPPRAPGETIADAPADPPESAEQTFAGLQAVYEQSCVNRAYGSFDDVCDQISRQIDAYRRKAAQEQRVARRLSSNPRSMVTSTGAPPNPSGAP